MVHGLHTEADDGNVAMVFEKIVLVAQEFAKQFGVFAAERVWNVSHYFVDEAFFHNGAEVVCLGAFGLNVEDITLNFPFGKVAVDASSGDEDVWE